MLILSNTLKTFDRKVNKIKSLAKKKYYLQETLKNTNEEIDLILFSLKRSRNKYTEISDYLDTSLVIIPEEGKQLAIRKANIYKRIYKKLIKPIFKVKE